MDARASLPADQRDLLVRTGSAPCTSTPRDIDEVSRSPPPTSILLNHSAHARRRSTGTYGTALPAPVHTQLPVQYGTDPPVWRKLLPTDKTGHPRLLQRAGWRAALLKARALRRTVTMNDASDSGSDAESTDMPIGAEELAELNAIINTRRSMAAAHALAQSRAASLTEYEMDTKDTQTECSEVHKHMRGGARAVRNPSPYSSRDPSPSTISTGRDLSPARRAIRFAPLPDPYENRIFVEEESSGKARIGRSNSTGSMCPGTSIECDRMEERASTSRAWNVFARTSRDESSASQRSAALLEERLRRRELVRAIRPGGTGMVTLLDGERIPARHVGDKDIKPLHASLWGFAALERLRVAAQEEKQARAQRNIENACETQRRRENKVAAIGAEARKRAQKNHYVLADPDPSVSIPTPSPLLPRRPDAKGISVVPLPQLGKRPERPKEGRFWTWNDFDGLSDSDVDDALSMRATTRAAEQELLQRSKLSRASQPWDDGAKHPAERIASPDDEFWPAPSATRQVFAPKQTKNVY
ncbi:hypothetical protein MVES_001508 [Malassezia vespertilionis]|uniref:Uncharacterized protein n=2 Tax=Malassezia vespertilionis TaxID=2020962 RepID=A0A2N1JCT8_9BASI|nr:hypothetical protein MVES_001508 [Malassezia vespertilionis]